MRALLSKTSVLVLDADRFTQHGNRTIFWQGFWSEVLNPKVALFFLALLPQFIATDGTHQTWWPLALGITSNAVALIINCLLVLFSSAATAALRQRTHGPVAEQGHGHGVHGPRAAAVQGKIGVR